VAGPLTGKVALVAGATRGAGRGTAVALGEAGATVYCTGRTTRKRRSEYDRPETIEETAEQVDDVGGEGIAVELDHLQAAQVEALIQRIEAEQGRLDVLVNDIWGGESWLSGTRRCGSTTWLAARGCCAWQSTRT
jgi:NAD(P)-dependent dehydrogenase (short-subunit alcohol dehydrogenase family)